MAAALVIVTISTMALLVFGSVQVMDHPNTMLQLHIALNIVREVVGVATCLIFLTMGGTFLASKRWKSAIAAGLLAIIAMLLAFYGQGDLHYALTNIPSIIWLPM